MGNIVNGFKLIGSDEPKVLILGQFPGWDSIRAAQKQNKEEAYYSNSQNIFWHTIECIVGPRKDNESNNEYLSRNGIALWDVIAKAELISDENSKISKALVYNKIVEYVKSKNTLNAIIINGIGVEDDLKIAMSIELKAKIKYPSLYFNDLPCIPLYSTSPSRKRKYSDELTISKWCETLNKYLN